MKIFHNNFFVKQKFAALACLLFVMTGHITFGQLSLVPLGSDPEQQSQPDENMRTAASLALPFFDDFSSTKDTRPATARWVAGSGVYINNSLTTDHPSVNVATFDGLNAGGLPYNIVNPLTQGFTDTLTSQPINLANRTRADSLYISFYWSAKGLGELPDSSDFMQLEFLNSSNEWVVAWKKIGYNVPAGFHQQFVGVSDAAFYHGAFQFRFRTYGRSSGPYDTWHLDYVYLNTKRSSRQPYIFDVAMRRQVTPFLKRFTAMPLRQYLYGPAAVIADSMTTDIANNFNNFNVLTGTVTISDARSGKELARNVQRSLYIESLKSKSLGIKLAAGIVPASTRDSIRLINRFYITTTDTIPGVNLKYNDTITSVTNLSDYYAYDDGTAEYGMQVNQKLARAAVRFVLTKPDTLGGVRMSMVSFNKNIAGQGFVVQLLSNKNGKPDQVITQRSVAVRYSAERNGFVDYSFAVPVAVKDTFYIGWMQFNDDPVIVGFDRNSQLGAGHIFYNLGTEWVKEDRFKGSIMVHPYLGSQADGLVTGVEPSVESVFYPNPAKGSIHWDKNDFSRIDVYGADGKHMHTITPEKHDRSAAIPDLPTGLYYFRGSSGKRTMSQQILIYK
ncbi:T9SS type A sorting domain-containing protein [Dyadobacter sandarakinus]|uniref:T9SS type A sorting domain-containing protein n=1 Tax=Dyadobacter sandarakinus TaxID=2747268 RepID=A0ABX7IBX7_9BACT|nr:T9SS type A sorting domain-containing protein [Dyadobacter sandarakinus]QRR03601.1 T9SS type A sorting domain-containing protein [Dyadobacter sandarakinus]